MLDGNSSDKKILSDKDYEDVNIENLYDMMKKIKSDIKYINKNSKKTIEEELDLKLDDEEISNIAVHVGGAIERCAHNQKKKVFKVIIVCVSGIGTSMLIKNKLEYLFEDKILNENENKKTNLLYR